MQDSPLSQYLLLFRSTDWPLTLAPEQIQEIMARTNNWFERLHKQGITKAAQPLEPEGRVISAHQGILSDGPFVETKESIGGYLLIAAGDFEEAMEIARGNPMIPHGLIVEVRPVAENCPTVRRALERATAAHV